MHLADITYLLYIIKYSANNIRIGGAVPYTKQTPRVHLTDITYT